VTDTTLFRIGSTSKAFASLSILKLASVLALLLARRKEVRKLVYWGSVAVIVPLAIVAAYFAYWGVIGVRMWA
jgi:hypothetical protein